MIPTDPTTWPYPLWRYDNEHRCLWNWEDEAALVLEQRRAEGEAMAREDATPDPDEWWRS